MNNNLRFLMNKHNVTPTQLARELKMSRNTVYRLLNDEGSSATTLFKVANYFNMKVDDVFCVKNVLHEVRGNGQSA